MIKEKRQVRERIEFFGKWLEINWDWSRPVTWVPKVYDSRRSMPQNALFHVWVREMAKSFTERGHEITDEQMKMILKNRFLGTEDITIHNTVIPGQLRKTSNLLKGEMMVFLDQVWEWAADHGVVLQIPADSDYMRYKQETTK